MARRPQVPWPERDEATADRSDHLDVATRALLSAVRHLDTLHCYLRYILRAVVSIPSVSPYRLQRRDTTDSTQGQAQAQAASLCVGLAAIDLSTEVDLCNRYGISLNLKLDLNSKRVCDRDRDLCQANAHAIVYCLFLLYVEHLAAFHSVIFVSV